MNILMIEFNIDKMGGVERVMSTLANELSKVHNIYMLSKYKNDIKPFYDYDNSIKRHYIIDAIKYKSNNFLKKNYIYYFHRFFEKFIDKIKFRKNIKKYNNTFDKFDIIIFGSVLSAIEFLPYINKSRYNVKIIVRDAMHLDYFSKKIKKKINKYFIGNVDKFIVSSEESLIKYKSFFKNSNIDLIKIYNPIGIKPIKQFNFEAKSVISIGRFDKQKGFDNLIQAFILVHNYYPDWTLQIYGNGNYKGALEKIINNNNANSYIFLKPSSKNVVEVFNNSSIFVCPSRYEGYANVLVEAMACGMPCISYNWIMGVSDIIKNNENGIIVDLVNREDYFNGNNNNKDIELLGNKIKYLIENKKIAENLGSEAYKIIESRNIDIITKNWLNIIDFIKKKGN